MKNRFSPLHSRLLGITCALLASVAQASDVPPFPPAPSAPPAPPSSPTLPMLAQAPVAQVPPAAPKAQPAPRPAPPARPAPAASTPPLPPDDEKSLRRAPTEDESLALAAIEGLMSMPPDRALPLLKKVLAGQQTVLVKRRALFVVGQIDNDEAVGILLDTARNGAPSLKYDAIRNIGIHGNQKGLKALQDLYTAGDSRVKREVLSAWLIAGRKEEVYQVAATSKDEKDVAQAIRTLSAMGAREELRKLAEVQKSHRGLVQAYAVSGDLESLVRIANSNGELATRVDAVRSMGIIGNEPARKALREIYLSSGDKSLRDAALHGMHVSGDQQGVLALYRAAKTSEEKRALLRTLSVMGGDAALDAIDAALEGKK